MLINASSRGTLETVDLGPGTLRPRLPVVLLRLRHRKSPENSSTPVAPPRRRSQGGRSQGGRSQGKMPELEPQRRQVLVWGQMCPPAGRPSEAGRTATTREHMLALRWAAGAGVCYFLLTQPTCAAEPCSCSETDADLLQPDEDESGLMADKLRFLSGF